VHLHILVSNGVHASSAFACVVRPLLISVRTHPLFLVHSSRKRVKLATTLFLGSQLKTTLNLDLIHAAFFFLSLNIACRHKDALMGILMCSGHFSKRLPAICQFDDLIRDALLVQSRAALHISVTDILLVARAHSKSKHLQTIVVDLVFLIHNRQFGIPR